MLSEDTKDMLQAWADNKEFPDTYAVPVTMGSIRTMLAAVGVCETVRNLRREWTSKHVVNTPLELRVVECIMAFSEYDKEHANANEDHARTARASSTTPVSTGSFGRTTPRVS